MLSGTANPRKRQRKSCGRPRSHSAPALMVSDVVKKRKLWSNESMCAAIEAAKSSTSVYRAAIEHRVPRMTLQDRISGQVVHGVKSGPKPYLSPTEKRK